MPGSQKQPPSQLKDDLGRQLRSSSPAIKRPASDMGAQDREEHSSDVDMGEGPDSGLTPANSESPVNADTKAKQQDTGQRHRDKTSAEDMVPAGDPRAVPQQAASESSSSVSDCLQPTPSVQSTAATSLSIDIPSSATAMPSIDEQIVRITQLAQKEIQDKQKGYLISSKWLYRVQARGTHPPDGRNIDKSATEGEIGPVDNSDLVMITEDSGKLKDEAGEPYVPLERDLNAGEDFEILPQEAWDLVISWYGLAKESPVITRYAHDWSEADAPANVTWELNPPIFSFLKVPSELTPKTQREKDLPPRRMLASKKTPFMEWLRKGKELVNIDMNTKVRVWRILGGLKSSAASGMLTPAVSRSTSPAPGAEIVASAGDRMLLDVNTFATLAIGEQREQLDQSDQTANPKYNGRLTLSTVGLGRDEVIVLEEQKGGPAGGEWPSEHLKLTLGKAAAKDKAKGLTPSGRSSPAPGMMTRGRQRRDGRPRGITGLSNLGNTCYMNSALQCIRSVEELTQYFLHDQWKKDLNPNNPLGHHGEIAKAYANLVKQIYEENASSTNPSRFKATVGKYGSSFSGYQQQDSQEFLLFLLDGLQEDLNRIHKKPYIEKPDSTDDMVHDHAALKAFADKNWEDYKARNDSVITDLFAGMYKSTLTCPVCDKVSIIFDPFNNLTLQLPIENTWSKEILYFPLYKRPFRVDVDIDKHSSIRALKEFVAKRTHADVERLLVAESYKNKIYKIFDNNVIISEANIQSADIICVYELDSVPTNYNPNKAKRYSLFPTRDTEDDLVDVNSPEAERLLVPVYNRLVKAPGARPASKPFFGQPTYVVLGREDRRTYDGVLKKILGNVAGMTTKNILDDDTVASGDGPATPEGSDTVVMADDTSSSGSNLPTTVSVQSEDGLVDVSMRDPSQTPETTPSPLGSDQPPVPTVLQPSTFIPPQLQGLFTMTVASTGEGIPTGWNQITESHDYDSIASRIPKPISHRPARSNGSLNAVNGDSGSTTSDDDLADIDHDDTTPGSNNDSGSESNASPPFPSGADSDSSSLPEVRELVKQRNPKISRTYSRRGRKIQGKRVPQRRTPPAVQPHPHSEDDGLIRPGEAIVLDWTLDAFEALFGGTEDDEEEQMRGAPTWKSVELLHDGELIAKRAQRTSRKKNGVTLEDCLNEFGKSETLSENNAWYCPRCKAHRRADKMFELWKAPDILVMHLKRFSSNRNFRDKLEVRVEYPTEGLDLSAMVRDKEDGKSLIYDLVAVDNHYGGLGGGHYTAYAKNFINHAWYEYNDSHVSSKTDPRSVVTSAAYLLFYRRRSDHPLGGPALQQLLEDATTMDEVDSEALPQQHQQGSRDPSPVSGEGRRLGDSSHIGSSSASGAGQVHLVGDGGLGMQQRLTRDRTREEESPPKLTVTEAATSDDADLPGYTTDPPPYDDQSMNVDEGLDLSFPAQGPPLPWEHSTWGFGNIGSQRMAAPSENEMFGDRDSSNDSTRVEGDLASSPHSLAGDDGDPLNDPMYSEALSHDDYGRRSLRESAPAPEMPGLINELVDEDEDEDVDVGDDEADDDDDEELPVMELTADPANNDELVFKPASH